MIWDFDDDNALKPVTEPAMPTKDVLHVTFQGKGCSAFNPYPSMGGVGSKDASTPPCWPRGYPLELVQKPCSHNYTQKNASRIAVLQSLADNDPDVDAIFRLTRGVPFNFDASSKHTLVVPAGTLSPYNAQVGPETVYRRVLGPGPVYREARQ